MKALIMCGGSGTRLWPLSTSDVPKQFLCLVDETRSMFQMSCILAALAEADEIIVVLNERFQAIAKQQLTAIRDQIPKWRLVIEPISRNTAPAILAGILGVEHDDDVVLVMPSDHVWETERFVEVVKTGVEVANTHRSIVTVGITPTYPETGYGYIELELSDEDAHDIVAFREKPDLQTARVYFDSGKHLWNSGVFIFRKDAMVTEMLEHAPAIHEIVSKALTITTGILDQETFSQVENISIDYAIMERSKKRHVIPFFGEWNDVGSFRSIKDISEKDEKGNTFIGDVRAYDTSDTLLHSKHQGTRFNLLGVKDLIIAQSEDGSEILITTPAHCQDVKKFILL